MNKILYIAGYGRSGSTVLDVILGNHPDIVSVGELAYLLDDWGEPDRHCACGRLYRQCTFWKHLPDVVSVSEDIRRIVRHIEKRSRTFPILSGTVNLERQREYRVFQRRLFSYIQEQSGKSIVLDSSKSARDTALRFYALSKIADLDVYVLHLVRDGRATMASCVRKGSNWALEGYRQPKRFPGLRAALGWTLTNSWTVALAKRYLSPDRYLQIRFGDLTSDPASVLNQIGQFVGVEAGILVEWVEQGKGFEVGHNVGGNRVRLEKQIHLRTDENTAGDGTLNWYHQLCFEAIGGWVQRLLVRSDQSGSKNITATL